MGAVFRFPLLFHIWNESELRIQHSPPIQGEWEGLRAMPTLDWIGKKAVVNHHREVAYRMLKCDPALSVGEPGSGNLLVQGDNLLALKALLPYYAGQVKCIYIDPPYNTGNEGWIYNDAANAPEIKRWLGKVIGKEAEDLSRHDKWLCLMYPRLQLLRELLSDDGAIFVSIDDNESHHLRLLLDEIFGPRNFVANILWQKKYAVSNDHKTIAPMHDHIFAYRKSEKWQRRLLPRPESKNKLYRHEDEKGIFRPDNYTCSKSADERPNLFYAITNPNTGEEIWPKRTRVWAYSREENAKHAEQGLIYWGKEGTGKVPSIKRYKHLLRHADGVVPQTWWTHEFAGHTDAAKKEIRSIFGEGTSAFDFITPKPTQLIERVLQLGSDPDSLILDAFGGSGTTGHAVAKLNAADGGTRRFILIEMETAIAGPITAERLKHVKLKSATDNDDSAKATAHHLGIAFSFCMLSVPLFDETGHLCKSVTFSDLARHVFFTETGEPLPQKVSKASPLIGKCKSTAYYLLFNGVLGDKRPDGGNVLTGKVLEDLPNHDGPKVVFGEGCRLSAARLARESVTFKQIPYEIKVS